MERKAFFRRLIALCRKETFQIFRDPSSNLIAFVLPVVMLVIFGYGINLDSTVLRVGLVLQDTAPEAREFAASLRGSRYRDGKRQVHDVPYPETKEFLAGFGIIDVPNLDAASEWAACPPAAAIASVEIRPLLGGYFAVGTPKPP
jgi:hypothetical protein